MESKKRTLDSFFKNPKPKKPRLTELTAPPSSHLAYPFPVAQFPQEIIDILGFAPASEAETINDQPHLDVLYFKPYVPKEIAKDLFAFLRDNLFFYRVEYKIKRGSVETDIHTPRFTTVFGVDDTARFADDGSLVNSSTNRPLPAGYYKCKPRPIPECLDYLRKLAEGSTSEQFNFCLVNYYASGSDSISYHSDDEQFLGPNPAIASFSLGATRDFLMKHKPVQGQNTSSKPLKFTLGSGHMILMRGTTQANWLHSIPKRKIEGKGIGRINITFRRALVKGGTENYYQYNVGSGPAYRWDQEKKEMELI